MKLKYNGIETDGEGNPQLGIPTIKNGSIKMKAGDTVSEGDWHYTAPIDGTYFLPALAKNS